MQIYTDVDVSLLRFKYPATLKKRFTRNVWGFSLRDSSDEDCVFAGLKEFLLVHKFLSLLQQSEIMLKSHSVQNINYIVPVADE